MYRYFVSYTYVTGYSSGFGNCELIRDLPIASHVDVRQIGTELAAQNGFQSLIVLNFQEFPAH